MTDLVERLRMAAEDSAQRSFGSDIFEAAAATISTLRAGVKHWHARANKRAITIHDQRKRIEELEAALAQIRDQRGPYSNATVRRMAAIADAALRSREGGA